LHFSLIRATVGASTRSRLEKPMRFTVSVIAIALATTSCGSGSSPDEGGTEAQLSSAELSSYKVLAMGNGLKTLGPDPSVVEFGDPVTEVREKLNAALGEPKTVIDADNCEIGSLQIVEYPGNIQANFSESKFVGWTFQGATEPVIATSQGVTYGAKLDAVSEIYDLDTAFRPTPIGKEHTTDSGLSFFTFDMGEGQEVSSMLAGTVCFR
jgi:hypothetical protein